jgi:hypothetical protein
MPRSEYVTDAKARELSGSQVVIWMHYEVQTAYMYKISTRTIVGCRQLWKTGC